MYRNIFQKSVRKKNCYFRCFPPKWMTIYLPCDSPNTSLANILCPILLTLSNSLTQRETLSVLRASQPKRSTFMRRHLWRCAEDAESASGGVEDGNGSSPRLSSPRRHRQAKCYRTKFLKAKSCHFIFMTHSFLDTKEMEQIELR